MCKQSQFKKSLSKKLKSQGLSINESLSIILKEVRQKGNLQSCLLTDAAGLILAHVVHKGDNKDNLAAASSLIIATAKRITDYLKTSPIQLSFFISKSTLIWVKPIPLPKCKDDYILILMKSNSIYENMSKQVLKLLNKERSDMIPLLDIATKFIAKVCS